MKKWVIISVLVLIVGITIWYAVYAKKDQAKLESTNRKMLPQSDSPELKVIHSAISGRGTKPSNNPKAATAGRG